ncbi:MAG TPA: hypothetical protein VIG72_06560 [Pontibacter sp.]
MAKIIVPIFLILLVVTNFYSMGHFSDGGCDGGTCSILLFIYSVPLTISWLLAMFGTLLILRKKTWGVIFSILSFWIATALLPLGDDQSLDELKHPLYLLICINLYFIFAPLVKKLYRGYIEWKEL